MPITPWFEDHGKGTLPLRRGGAHIPMESPLRWNSMLLRGLRFASTTTAHQHSKLLCNRFWRYFFCNHNAQLLPVLVYGGRSGGFSATTNAALECARACVRNAQQLRARVSVSFARVWDLSGGRPTSLPCCYASYLSSGNDDAHLTLKPFSHR